MSVLLSNLFPEQTLLPIPLAHSTLDSRAVGRGDLFVAVKGENHDGRDYIAQAVAKGAAAVIYDGEGCDAEQRKKFAELGPVFQIDHLGDRLSSLGHDFYRQPSAELSVIGVTGTNGKTSVTHFLADSLTKTGISCGVMGTLGFGKLDSLVDFGLTTPDPISVHRQLRALREAGCTAVALEASSHGLEQNRLEAVLVRAAVFTNISHDHLDYHGELSAYQAAKKKLFEMPSIGTRVFNIDDLFGAQLATEFGNQGQCITYSLTDASANIYCKKLVPGVSGQKIEISTPWGEAELNSTLLGEFNVQNLLASLAVLCGVFNLPLNGAVRALESVDNVKGRMDSLGGPSSPAIVIDYAHTPDALKKAMIASRQHCRGKLLCVFGCGGNRDRGKRAQMGNIASTYADFTIITNDNPRGEDPAGIAEEILSGMKTAATEKSYQLELDRSEAIELALNMTADGDLVLIAGKGHEPYQDLASGRIPYSDYDVVNRWLANRVGYSEPC